MTGVQTCALPICKFSGAEFTAFVIAFAVFGMVVAYAPEVQEISIAGNVVKLKEVKAEALKAIASLNKSRIEMLRIFFGLALRHGGGWASEDPIDPRVADFWKLIGLAKENKCLKELKSEATVSVRVLMIAQLANIARRNLTAGNIVTEPFISPIELAALAFDAEGITQASALRSPLPDDYRGEIKIALEEYSKLYEFNRKLDEL